MNKNHFTIVVYRKFTDQVVFLRDGLNKMQSQIIFGIGGDPNEAPVSVVDAKKENERLQQNKAQGKPATAGETPAVDR